MDPVVPGHFTTMQARGGAVQALDLHLARLREAGRELCTDAFDEDALRARMREALAEAGGACTLRIACRAGAAPSVEVEPAREPAAAPLRVRSHRGLRDRPHIKHLDLGLQLAARRAAQVAGFDDALLVDADGRIAEGTFWNLALLDGRGIVWPEAPILEGITQRRLQAALAREGVPQRRAVVRLGGLAGMRAAFAFNSRGLQEIGSVDGDRFPGDRPMAERLRALLDGDPWQRP